MATMKTLNGYGFNATELNGKTSDNYLQLGDDEAGSTGEAPKINADTLGGVDASNYLKKTDTASDTSKLGGKAPEYYLQPRNLLDNSDFRNPVNQRGIDYGANRNGGYTIDRWYYEQSAGAGDGYFGLTEYYISVLAPSDGYSQMYQNLEKYAKLKGKNVTFAARVSRGSTEKIVCVTFTLGSIDVGLTLFEDGNLKLYSVDGMNILIRATGAKEFQFIWAALYEGSYTADTPPPSVPKGYASDLAECQRYYELVGVHKYSNGRKGEVYFNIQFTQKRISPTVTMALETASNNITNKGELRTTNRTSAGGLLFYANDANMSYWYGHATVSADL